MQKNCGSCILLVAVNIYFFSSKCHVWLDRSGNLLNYIIGPREASQHRKLTVNLGDISKGVWGGNRVVLDLWRDISKKERKRKPHKIYQTV